MFPQILRRLMLSLFLYTLDECSQAIVLFKCYAWKHKQTNTKLVRHNCLFNKVVIAYILTCMHMYIWQFP